MNCIRFNDHFDGLKQNNFFATMFWDQEKIVKPSGCVNLTLQEVLVAQMESVLAWLCSAGVPLFHILITICLIKLKTNFMTHKSTFWKNFKRENS